MGVVRFHNAELQALALSADFTPAHVEAIGQALSRRDTLRLTPLKGGLFPASAATDVGSSGYGRVWVRDNVYVALAALESGNEAVARGVARQLLTFYRTHRHRFEDIVAGRVAPGEIMQRPHVRFDGDTLEEITGQRWPHAQNDALGYFLWLCARLWGRGVLQIDAPQLDTLTLLVRYFEAVRYWEDEDSGHWEETRKISASSIGVVVAGLREWRDCLRRKPKPDAAVAAAAPQLIDDAIERGQAALAATLPGECAQLSAKQNRRYDAALIFLLYPLQVVDGAMAALIADDVRRYLMGPVGIRRHLRDSYWAPDYERRVAEADRTRDYSDDLTSRDALITDIGQEAQWCIFDPILSAFYGHRFLTTGESEDRDAQRLHFVRALAHITPDWRCPELYYSNDGTFVPNPHTPLQWTQANLQLALQAMRRTAAG